MCDSADQSDDASEDAWGCAPTSLPHPAAQAVLLSAIAETADDYIFCKDTQRRYTFINPAMARLFGCAPDDLLGKTPEDIFDAETARIVAGVDIPTLEGKIVSEVRDLDLYGVHYTFHTVQVPLRDGDGRVIGISGIVRDITSMEAVKRELAASRAELAERVKERTQELEQAHAELEEQLHEHRRIEREVLTITTRQRRQLGQLLHDNLGQQLAGALYLIEASLKEQRRSDSDPLDSLTSAREAIHESLRQVKSVARGISPVSVDDDGLAVALERLLDDTTRLFQAKCILKVNTTTLNLDPALAIEVYQIAQEALTNAARHAHCTRIVLSLDHSEDQDIIRICDDGIGFDAKSTDGLGLGLRIMRYRADMIGADLTIVPADGGGTCVECRIPASSEPETCEDLSGHQQQ